MTTKKISWKLQHSNRAKGRYYQIVWGKGKSRVALTLGYLSDDYAALASRNLPSMPAPESLVISCWDGHGTPPPPSRASLTKAARHWLFADGTEEIQAAIDKALHSEPARLEADGNYGAMRLRDFYARIWWPVRSAEVAESTVKNERQRWETHILPALGQYKMRDLNAVRWHRFLMSQPTWSGRNKALTQNAYRCCLKYAVEIGAIPQLHNFRPITKVKTPKTPLTLPEVEALLDAATTPTHRALYAAAIGLGLRPGEVVALRWEDLDLDSGAIRVRGTKTEGSDSTIPLTPLARRELVRFSEEMDHPRERRMFLWNGLPFKEFIGGIKRAGKRAGIQTRVTPYVCRHTFAMLAAMAGIPRAATTGMMRHSHSSTILERAYSNIRQEQVRQAIQAFPALPGDAGDQEEESGEE